MDQYSRAMTQYPGWYMWGGPRHSYCGFASPDLHTLSKATVAWRSKVFCKNECRRSVLMDDSQVIAGGRGLIAALDPTNGTLKWDCKVDVTFENLSAMNQDIVMVGDFVVDRKKGRLIQNVAKATGAVRTTGWCIVFPYEDGFFTQILRHDKALLSVFVNPQGNVRELPLGAYSVSALDPNRGIALAYAGDDSGRLCRVDLRTGKSMWSFNPPRTKGGKPYISYWPAFGKKYYYAAVYNDSLLAVNMETGQMEWLGGEKSQTEWDRPLGSVTPSQVLVSDHYVVITDFCKQPGDPWQKYMACFDADTGSSLWHVPMRTYCKYMCIRGSYIFGTQNEHPVAWSLSTGEEVWQSDERIDSVYVIAHGNRVLYETASSELVCFEF